MVAMPQARRCLRAWTTSYQAAPVSVPLARRQVRAVMAGWGWGGTGRLDDLLIICAELVTNAIQHASEPNSTVLVRLQELDGDCRIEVMDRRPDLLPPRVSTPKGERGRGLLLVRELAEDMDVTTTKGSKIVWARVLRHHGEAA